MGHTIRFDERGTARLTNERIETVPPDRVEFVAEGLLTVTESKLAAISGTRLRPTTVTLSVEDERPASIDLTEEPTLRLEEADVGIESPGADALASEADALDPTTDDDPAKTSEAPGALAFTVDGTIHAVPQAAIERLAGSYPTLRSITFARDATRSDGGSNDAVLAMTLLGFGIVVHRDGVVQVGAGSWIPDV